MYQTLHKDLHKHTQTNTWSGIQRNVDISGHICFFPLQKSRRVAQQPLTALKKKKKKNTARRVGKKTRWRFARVEELHIWYQASSL